MVSKRYIHEMLSYETFEERLHYLRVNSKVGLDTFGYDRYLNQQFYHSPEWRKLRDQIIVRDSACDLACRDRPIIGKIYIHHLNPISPEQLTTHPEEVLNPDFLVCCSFETHQAIHYGHESLTPAATVERKPNDTCPWKH